MFSNSLVRQTNAMARNIEVSQVAQGLGLNPAWRGQTVRVVHNGTERTGLVTSVTSKRQGAKVLGFFITVGGIEMNWADCANLVVVEPALPTCTGFTGTGQRCGTCRVHRNTHA
jgi:hypothetical protein